MSPWGYAHVSQPQKLSLPVNWLIRLSLLLLGLAVIGWVLKPMLEISYPMTHSTQFNLSWGFQYQRQFFQGQFYPRWLEFSNFGFGNATFAFYPPLCMVATLPFKALGLGLNDSLVASMGLAVGCLGLGIWLYARCFFPIGIAAGVAGLGMVGPYFLVDVYQRGAIGEAWAIAVVPWIWWGSQLVVIYQQRVWPIMVLALAYGLLVLSHLPTLLLFTLAWIPFPWIMAPSGSRWSTVRRCYTGAALAFGWTAFFLWPATVDQIFVQIGSVNALTEYVPQNRLMIQGLLQLQPEITTHWFETDLIGPWWVMVGIIGIGGLVVSSVWLKSHFSKIALDQTHYSQVLHQAAFYWCITGLITLLMMTDILSWIYALSTTLRRIQFSWRWMGITTLLVPLIWGYLLYMARLMIPKGNRWLPISISLVSLTILSLGITGWHATQVLDRATFNIRDIQLFEALADQKQFPYEPEQRPGRSFIHWHWIFPDGLALVDVPEYRADGVTKPMPPPTVTPLLQWQPDSEFPLEILAWDFGRRRFVATNPSDSDQRVVLRTFYYPAWRTQLDRHFQPTEKTADGQLAVTIPPGKHDVTVTYLGTPMDWLGRVGTGGTLLGSLIWLLVTQKSLAKSTVQTSDSGSS